MKHHNGCKRNVRRPCQPTQKGFTLIEIMVVVVIMGVLIGLVAPNVLGRVDEARVTAAAADVSMLSQSLELYRLDNQSYPTTDQGLMALVQKPSSTPAAKSWNPQGYVSGKSLPKDPWGNDYQYLSPGADSAYDVYSLGADGKQGGENNNADIGNWEEE
ncbi:MAG: type II secretion system major pseudopilin GspG [Pseudomonadales bacterium]